MVKQTITYHQWTIHHYDVVTSTNLLAREFIQAGNCHQVVLVAKGQTHGQGQRGASFYSPANQGLYMSLIIKSPIECPVSILAPVVVVQSLAQIGIMTSIKWVNDIIYLGKKAGGILIEQVMNHNEQQSYYIIGIGLNLSTTQFPLELQHKAIALGTTKDQVPILIETVLNGFDDIPSNEQLLNAYSKAMIGIGNQVRFIDSDEWLTVQGIDYQGALIVKSSDEHDQTISSNSLQLIWKGLYE